MSLNCTQMVVTPGCRRFPNGTTQPVLIHTEYGINAAGTIVVVSTRFTNSASTPITLGVGETVTPGPCIASPVVISSGAANVAGLVRSAALPFSGVPATFSTSAIVGKLQSITITARGVDDGTPGQSPNEIRVFMPDGSSLALMDGEARTWSVTRDQDTELVREFVVTATGNAYANISWTVV